MSGIEFGFGEVSDEEESCSESEDHVEEADSSDDSSGDSDNAFVANDKMMSKNGQITYSKKPFGNISGRVSRENVSNLMPGLTRYLSSRITQEEFSSFELFFPPPLIRIILKYTNIEGRRIFDKEWIDIDTIELFAFIGLLLLSGVFRSHNESSERLWDSQKGRPIFAATMSLKNMKKISRVIRFDNRETRSERRLLDKFTPIRELWNQWVET